MANGNPNPTNEPDPSTDLKSTNKKIVTWIMLAVLLLTIILSVYVYKKNRTTSSAEGSAAAKITDGYKHITADPSTIPAFVNEKANNSVLSNGIDASAIVNGFSVSQSTNITVIVGGGNLIGNGTGTVVLEKKWPKDFPPTRSVSLQLDSQKKVGEKVEIIVSIDIGEDVLFAIPKGWNVKSFTSKDLDNTAFELAIGDKISDPAYGNELIKASTIRYRNLSTQKPMKVGFRCIRVEEEGMNGLEN